MSTAAKTEESAAKPAENTETPGARAAAAKRAKWALYLIVFFSGAVLMGVEIAGAKVLAPGFGTSTFVWGSIIGLFMAALAVGYYLGGMLADRRPSFSALATIVSLAGVWTALVIPRFGPNICDWVARQDLGPVLGPLIAAGAVFFLPSFLMGTVSPYAVKLQASSLASLGGVAGRLYALSTFGSIVGTLLTTFVLIPKVFLSGVMQGLGVFLVIIAIVSLFLFLSAAGKLKRQDRTGLGVMALIALICAEIWVVFPVQPHVTSNARMLHYVDSPYHEVLVIEDVVAKREAEKDYVLLPVKTWTPVENQPRHAQLSEVRRWLKFNENTESGIYPYQAEYKNAVEYTDLLHLPLIWLNQPPPRKVLVVGGGGGIIPSQYFSMYGSHVVVAEIDGVVADTAKQYFQVPKTDQIDFQIGDGRQIVKKLKDRDYDLIVLDAYSSGGQIPFHLLTWEFLSLVKSKLTERGVLATNIISGLRNTDPSLTVKPADLFLAEYKTLLASRAEVTGGNSDPADNAPLFKPEQLYVFPKVWESGRGTGFFETYRNVIVIATQEEKRLSDEQLKDAITALTTGQKPVVKIPNLPFHAQQIYQPVAADLKEVPVLRDDYAPVDLMYRPVRREETSYKLIW